MLNLRIDIQETYLCFYGTDAFDLLFKRGHFKFRSQTKKSATKKPWPAKDVPIPPLLEPLELKKARHKSADVSSGSRNAPPQLSPSLPKVDLRKNGSTSEKESLSSAGAGTTAVVIKDAVVWSGDLIIDGVPLSAVQLMSNALTFKPCGL